MNKAKFGEFNNQSVSKYEIANASGMKAVVTDLGATLVSVFVKDNKGDMRDVVLGFDDADGYKKDRSYFGATVGRNCNRIANARIKINDIEYTLEDNDNGNNLHSGSKGLTFRVWELVEHTANSIKLSVKDGDLEQGFPGNATISVEYKVSEENEIIISYSGEADKDTVFNMTNHSYFNLNGHDGGSIFEQQLMLNASSYTPLIVGTAIPSGEIAPVAGTPFDFTSFKAIGQDINADDEQLKTGNGYDHNYVIDKGDEDLALVAKAYSQASGITLEAYSDCPGVQLYTANYVGTDNGKGGAKYQWRDAFCLETQYFPNSINEPNFKAPITKAGEKYSSVTIYKFGIK